MASLDFETVNTVALRLLEALCQRWFPDGRRVGNEWVARNPHRRDRRSGSFSINLRTGRWCDFASGERGNGAVSMAAFYFQLSQQDALERLAEMLACGERE